MCDECCHTGFPFFAQVSVEVMELGSESSIRPRLASCELQILGYHLTRESYSTAQYNYSR
ncbi:hypothetical protein B0T14DRAFT_531352 [Immersiella caudata]|uniref:Uncharacterized protein n=1 Tax=Immersiella caudata TaxID=314043 RepID=A0AA39T1Z2_9PEZI|nr:hypothetical protein B0T14DRAFT_531352 [Immersiella caudata]